jgi:hypothetical protein
VCKRITDSHGLIGKGAGVAFEEVSHEGNTIAHLDPSSRQSQANRLRPNSDSLAHSDQRTRRRNRTPDSILNRTGCEEKRVWITGPELHVGL